MAYLALLILKFNWIIMPAPNKKIDWKAVKDND